MERWLKANNQNVCVRVVDPQLKRGDDLRRCVAVFVSIDVPTKADGTQDLDKLRGVIAGLPDVPVFVRSTILPGTSEVLTAETGRRVHFMPEFLSERTADADFASQPVVVTGERPLLERIFVGKRIVEMSSLEAEVAKYAHNVFGALKVTYFNGIFDLCDRLGADYRRVREGVLASGYVNNVHTNVPGGDGRFGFGGKCFPKDLSAFAAFCREDSVGRLINPIEGLNREFRGREP